MADKKSSNNSNGRTNGHFKKGDRLHTLALSEMHKAIRTNNAELAQDAASKAWLATVEYLKGYLVEKDVPEDKLPKGERGRWYFINTKCSEPTRRLFNYLNNTLHANAYYEGIFDWEVLPKDISAVKELRNFLYEELNGQN